MAVESLEFDGSKFNLKNIPEDNLKDYVDYIIKKVSKSSNIFIVYLVKICKEFDKSLHEKLFTKLSKTGINLGATINEKWIEIRNINFLCALYDQELITGENIATILNNFECETLWIPIFKIIQENLRERDPEIFFDFADRQFDLFLQGKSEDLYKDKSTVYLSFKKLLTTIEDDDELFKSKVRMFDAQVCAEYIFNQAILKPEFAENFADFFANPPNEFDIELLTYEVLVIVVNHFEDITKSPLNDAERLGAGIFLAELFNVGLIGFRIMEDILKVISLDLSDIIIYKLYKNLIKRINHKVINSNDYGLRKFFETKYVTSLNLDEKESEKKDERFETFNSLFKIEEIARDEPKNLISNFLDQIEKNDKDEMISAVRKVCTSFEFSISLQIVRNAVIMYSFDSTKYLKNFIAMLLEFKSKSPYAELFRFAFKYAIDMFYKISFDMSEANGGYLVVNYFIGELTVELVNNAILLPKDIIKHWITFFERSNQKQNLYALMLKANDNVFKVNNAKTIQQLNYIKDELIKSVNSESSIGHLTKMMEILDKFGVNLIKIKKDLLEVSSNDLENLEVQDEKPKSSKKPRKRNKKKKKNKNPAQENEEDEPQDQDNESDSSEKLLSEESQPEAQEKSEVDEAPSQIESDSEDEISSFDIDSFKLLITEFEFCSKNQVIEKIKTIKIEGKSCLKVMAREYLEEMSQTDEKTIEGVVRIFDDIYRGFKNILGREIIKMLSEKLKDGFWSVEELQRLTTQRTVQKSTTEPKSKNPQQDDNHAKTENIQSKKKKKMMKKSKNQTQSEKPKDEKPDSKLILNNFMLEARETQNLLNFSIELFNLGWISVENFQKLLKFFIDEENFEMASKILKATSTRISQSSQVLTLNAEISVKKSDHHYFSFVEMLEKLRKNAEN